MRLAMRYTVDVRFTNREHDYTQVIRFPWPSWWAFSIGLIASEEECAEHGTCRFYDRRTRSIRCENCGHRFSTSGLPVRSTKSMAPWKWPQELLGRRRARKAGKRRFAK